MFITKQDIKVLFTGYRLIIRQKREKLKKRTWVIWISEKKEGAS